MIIGIPKEIEPGEYRVAILPVGVETLVQAGHKVVIQKTAGIGSDISDYEYMEAGAEIASKPADILYKEG